MKEQKDKRVLRVELDDEVKKVSITGLDGNEKVVMRQELDGDELVLATGGSVSKKGCNKVRRIIKTPILLCNKVNP
jgi:hypothetical protein